MYSLSFCMSSRLVIVLFYDNAWPHIAMITLQKITDFVYETFSHPPYFPDPSAQLAGAVEYTDWIYADPWCNGYRRRKWTRRHEFKSWTRLIAFHIALIPLGSVWIQLFSLQLWVNSRADWILQPWWGN